MHEDHDHAEKLKAMGIPQHQLDEARARGLNLGSLFALVQGLFKLLLDSGLLSQQNAPQAQAKADPKAK
jgi:hypothetical protein